jgi:hypothetical protein
MFWYCEQKQVIKLYRITKYQFFAAKSLYVNVCIIKGKVKLKAKSA